MKRVPNPQDLEAALKWWHSLPAGKKRYLKEHFKLGEKHILVRYWKENVK
jgi:hypothetical protein